MINNRQQNGRRRGRSNNNQRPQGGNSGGNRNADNGNRIDNRSRGNAAQLLEKYKTLARDAQQSGDRVLTEYYLQFSDHYFRVLADTRTRYEENQPRRDNGQDGETQQSYESGSDDGDEVFDGDEFDPRPQSRVQAPQAQPRYAREQAPQETRERSDDNDRPRRDYGDRPRNNNNGNGQDRSNGQDRAPRDERPVREDRLRDDRARDERPRDDRPVREARPRRDREPRVVHEDAPEESTLSLDLLPPAIAVAPMVETDEPVAPKRRGRPKKIVDEAAVEG